METEPAPPPVGPSLPRQPEPVGVSEQPRPWPDRPDSSFLAAVLTHLSDALVACDTEGRLTLFNPAALRLHGLPAEPIPPEQWASHYDLYLADGSTPMSRDEVPLFRALHGELVQDVEMVVHPTGRPPRRLQASGQQILGPDGALAGAVVLMHDVTGRRAAEALHAERVRSEQERRTTQLSLRRLQQLNAASLAVNGQHTVGGVLQAMTEQAAVVIGAEQAVSSLTRGEDWAQAITTVVLSERYQRWRDYTGCTDGSGIYALVCEGNAPVRLTQAELEQHPRWRGFGTHACDHPPMRGWLAAPLTRRDGSNLGLIQLSDRAGTDEAGRPLDFDDQDEAALVQLAQVASVALEKAVDFEREHQVAVELQRSMLPQHLAEVAGLATHVAYLPGRGESDLSVGGDFYDAFTLDDEHVALALGDVVGHGLLSASLMGQIRSALRALALLQHDPVTVVTALDRLVATLGEEAMATLAYGVLHVPSGRLRLVLAGHPPPLLRTAGESGWAVEHVTGEPGLPLGAFPGTGYTAIETVLAPGATLLLYSDGLVEHRTRSVGPGIDQLAAAFALAPDGLAELSADLVDRLTGGANEDDVALLLVQRQV